MIRFLVSILSVLFCLSCARGIYDSESSSSEKAERESEQTVYAVNPTLNHSLNRDEQFFRSFPFNKGRSDKERIDTAGFFHFIEKTNFLFLKSNLTETEAEKIYSTLSTSQFGKRYYTFLQDESEAGLGVGLQKFKEMVALRKEKTGGDLHLYHKYYDCGWNYSHRRILMTPADSAFVNIEEIETWVARRPC